MTAFGPPGRQTATQQDAGRTCPFCRFALKQGIDIHRCPGCQAPYHADCWSDNGGCAVMGCTGAPLPEVDRPGPAAVPTRLGDRVTATVTGATGGTGWGRSGIAMAIGALAVAVVVLAVALSRGASSDNGRQGVGTTTEQPSGGQPDGSGTTGGDPDTGGGDEGDTGDGSAPAELAQDEANRRQIREVLYRYHADILNDDYSGAWALMSHRKRQQKLREDGYGGWRKAQATLKPYLDPSGLDVSFQALDPRTGVARVLVTGMAWSAPRATCSEWSGITWMKYELGSWHYDPGYSTTAERERLWKPRASELLGVSC